MRDRILDAGATLLVTTNGYWRSGKHVSSKASADTACDLCEKQGNPLKDVIVVKRLEGFEVPMKAGRDTWWEDEISASDISDVCPAEQIDAEDPLFILYTSGSTGKPKGVLHTTGGYMVFAYATVKYVFDYKPQDVYLLCADIGWVTGHSYVVYGPLCNGEHLDHIRDQCLPTRSLTGSSRDSSRSSRSTSSICPNSHQGTNERGRSVAGQESLSVAPAPCLSGRADQP